MPICFTDPEEPLYVSTVEDNDESVEDDDDDDDVESRISASDFEGNLSDIPKRMLFGMEECGAIFVLPSDNGAFVRICGCKAKDCHREGHRTTRLTGDGLGKPGSYETVRSRKFVDGKLETWIPVEEYEADLYAAKAKQKQDLSEAASFLQARSPEGSKAFSPTGSEEDAYDSAFGDSNRKPWASKELLPSPITGDEKPVIREGGKPTPKVLLKPHPGLKVEQGRRKEVVSSKGRIPLEDSKEKDLKPEESMMELMAGVRDSLKAVAGGMAALQQGQLSSQATLEPKPAVRVDAGGLRFMQGKIRMGSSQSPASMIQDGRTDAGEWYAVAKGKEGASGVFDSYEDAKNLVYRVSGAVWKKFKFYEDAWMYVQEHMEDDVEEESGWFYGVANGRDHFNGVLIDYPTAKELVDRVSGATWKKFRSHHDAFEFVQKNRKDPRHKSPSPPRKSYKERGGSKERSPSGSRHRSRQEADPRSVTPPSRKYEREDKEEREAPGFPNYGSNPREGLRPPIELAGEDPSLKKEDEVWGVDVGAGERAVRDKLCPPGLPTNIQKGMVDSMVDAVATPGGSIGGTDEDLSGTDILGQAMEELVYQGRGGEDGGRKAELSWRQLKNTTLRRINDQEKLRKQIKTLVKLREKLPKRIVKACKNGLIRAGWTDPLLIEAWSQGGYLMRIGRDSMDYYLSLHQHLMGLASSEVPWSYVQVEIDHHVEELDLIRSSADSRFQCILCMYGYLRDGVASNWHSTSLQYKRNLDAVMVNNNGPLGRDSSPLLCQKCQTSLHSGGRGNCPWRILSDQAAKKKGASVLTNWANGICAPPPPPPE
jgi:viroplasmin and RNaseH domain-containing protein